MSRIDAYNNYINDLIGTGKLYDYKNKERSNSFHVRYMLCRTMSMFRYDGLPDTIPQDILELYLQSNGNVCFYKYNDNLYVFTGGLGGEQTVYYRPTIYTISNPALDLNINAEIGKDCVVVPNDSLYLGLIPMMNRYTTMMVENELSIQIASINTRMQALISAQDDKAYETGKQYIDKILKGDLSIIAESPFFDGIKTQPLATGQSSRITDLIELEQYLKASLFNELGLNANYNMKRESLNTTESQLNNDALLPYVDNMLFCRQRGIDGVNNMFGTNITVKYNSSWEDNMEEISAELKALSGQPESPEETNNDNEPSNKELQSE